jgi:hypothetical protein
LGVSSAPFSLQLTQTRNFKLNVMDNAGVNCTLGGGQGGSFFLRFHGCVLLASHTFRPPPRWAPSTPVVLYQTDADLYVRFGEQPDLIRHVWDCASLNTGSSEACQVSNPRDSKVVFARVVAFASFTDVVASCSGMDNATDASGPSSASSGRDDPTAAPVANQPTAASDGQSSAQAALGCIGGLSVLAAAVVAAAVSLNTIACIILL